MATVTHEQPKHLLTSTGKPSGCTIDGFILRRRARGSVHMLRKPPSWAFERALLEQAHTAGVRLVQVHDLESGIVYTTPLATLWRHGIRIRRGFPEQIALPLAHWHREDPKQPSLF